MTKNNDLLPARPTEPGTGASPTAPTATVRRLIVQVMRFQATPPTIALIALVLIIGLTHPRFFSNEAIVANMRAASFVAIIAIAMVFLLAMGEIDISIGGIYGSAFFVTAIMGSNGFDMYLAAAAGIATGVVMGLVNGALMQLFRAPVIIVTLGTFSLYRGVVEVLAQGGSIGQELPVSSSFFEIFGGNVLGIPVAAWVAVFLTIILSIVLNRSRAGAMIRAAGSNRTAARFTGIPDARLRVYTLMLVGGLAGLSGVLTLAYSQGGDATIGSGFELQVIAAAIIGGTAVTGGSGSVFGALIGAMLVATINSGLIFFGVNPLWNNIVIGAVILLAVGTTAWLSSRRTALRARGINA